MILVGCLVFCSFIRLRSIYGSTMYMKEKSEKEMCAQIYTLYRVQQLCKPNVFRVVRYGSLTEQFQAALSALS